MFKKHLRAGAGKISTVYPGKTGYEPGDIRIEMPIRIILTFLKLFS